MSSKTKGNDLRRSRFSTSADIFRVALMGFLLAFLLGSLGPWLLDRLDPADSSQEALSATFPEVEVRIDSEGTRLAGTLSLPSPGGPFPALLLISGAGAQDRDGLFFEHRRFAELAEAFNLAGIAVLRMDDRGVGGSEGNLPDATLQLLAQDAAASIRFLAAHPKVDAQRIGLIGGSEGSMVAALAASQSRQVDAVVLLSCLGLPGLPLLEDQHLRLARASGAGDEEARETLRLVREAANLATGSLPKEQIVPRLRQIDRDLMNLSPLRPFQANEELEREKRVELLLSPLFRDTLSFDPKTALSKLKQPALVIYGNLDLQTHPESNLPLVRQALEESDSPDTSFHVLPGVNHMLQPAETGHPSEYSQIKAAYDPRVIQLIRDWLSERWFEMGAAP
ncbi:MAG: alpha/beta fold hydrolase [Deltaproteobacteria bacterium]|nr:alpha/beta fold hydrolase [Deltaproteobacteria bacterium]